MQVGEVVQTYEYDSFGNMKHHGNKVKQPYTFTGREWDKEIGLYYYRARYYDPDVGRFISEDPIGFAGGDVNLYAYVVNNPVNWVDPWGLKWKERGLIGGIAAFWKVFGPHKLYIDDILLKPLPLVGIVLGILMSPSELDDPYLGPDGKWYFPDGTPFPSLEPDWYLPYVIPSDNQINPSPDNHLVSDLILEECKK